MLTNTGQVVFIALYRALIRLGQNGSEPFCQKQSAHCSIVRVQLMWMLDNHDRMEV